MVSSGCTHTRRGIKPKAISYPSSIHPGGRHPRRPMSAVGFDFGSGEAVVWLLEAFVGEFRRVDSPTRDVIVGVGHPVI